MKILIKSKQANGRQLGGCHFDLSDFREGVTLANEVIQNAKCKVKMQGDRSLKTEDGCLSGTTREYED